jgi:hypothetical protein
MFMFKLMSLNCGHPHMIYEYGKPRWNDTDRENPKNSEKNLYQCHFFHHKSHVD